MSKCAKAVESDTVLNEETKEWNATTGDCIDPETGVFGEQAKSYP